MYHLVKRSLIDKYVSSRDLLKYHLVKRSLIDKYDHLVKRSLIDKYVSSKRDTNMYHLVSSSKEISY